MRWALPILAGCAIAIELLVSQPARAYDMGDVREVIGTIDKSLAKAGELIRAKKSQDAAAVLAEASATFAALNKGEVPDDLRAQVERLGERLTAAQRLVAKAQGADGKSASAKATRAAAPTNPVGDVPAKQAAKAKKSIKPKKPLKARTGGPSFIADVAPVLIARCGNCHVRQERGGLSMTTFASLEKGAKSGPVIRPGASDASRIVEVIASGAMPRGGGRVSPEELLAIARWIDAGAASDGADRIGAARERRQARSSAEGTYQGNRYRERAIQPRSGSCTRRELHQLPWRRSTHRPTAAGDLRRSLEGGHFWHGNRALEAGRKSAREAPAGNRWRAHAARQAAARGSSD